MTCQVHVFNVTSHSNIQKETNMHKFVTERQNNRSMEV